jgi:rubrerythrin
VIIMNKKNTMLLNILMDAISIEIFGKEYYLKCSELVKDKNAKSIFKGLSRDKEELRDFFEKEYRKISGWSNEIGGLDEEKREKANRIFPEPYDSLSLIEAKNVLKIGIRTEERSIELYSKSAKKINDSSGKNFYLKIVNYKEGYKKMLEDALYYLEQEGSWYGYCPSIMEG